MGKRKVFTKTDLSTPTVEHARDAAGAVVIPVEILPPLNTTVTFHRGVGNGAKQFDFRGWYGLGHDTVTYVCQRQIERFLDGQDKELTDLTVRTLCQSGLTNFLDYITQLSLALRREVRLADIKRETIDGFLMALRDSGVSPVTQKNHYTNAKSILSAICKRGLIEKVASGDDATFPRNPFPGVSRSRNRGERPLAKAQRQAFSAAVKEAVMPIFSDEAPLTSDLLVYALLIIALHTGRNTWPLLEMTRDCLRAHPKNDRLFLVLYKRRSHSSNRVVLRSDNAQDVAIESMPTVLPNVARLIRRVLELSDRLRDDAPQNLRSRIWLYRMRTAGNGPGAIGDISSLNSATLSHWTKILVERFNLLNNDGKPLRINVSRLRKTFVNRIYEILDEDIVSTASAAGNTVSVTDVNYLRPGEHSQKNWKFMGVALVTELLSGTVGATEKTPVGQCSDSQNGDYAPKRAGEFCMSFLNCIRCRNYVVTGEDLHRLFSFYWRIFAERALMSPKRWQREFAHIIRLIDRDVINVGIAKGIFKQAAVEFERERARIHPHTFWQSNSVFSDLTDAAT